MMSRFDVVRASPVPVVIYGVFLLFVGFVVGDACFPSSNAFVAFAVGPLLLLGVIYLLVRVGSAGVALTPSLCVVRGYLRSWEVSWPTVESVTANNNGMVTSLVVVLHDGTLVRASAVTAGSVTSPALVRAVKKVDDYRLGLG